MSQNPQQYAVWKLRFKLAVQDPDMTGTRYHTTVFVETNPMDGSGTMHHVTGDITSAGGMYYDTKPFNKPEHSQTFHSKEFLGYTDAATHPHQWNALLQNVPPPPQQKAFNTTTMRTEPFKTREPLIFYQPGESRAPLIKCTEWTEQRAIPALQQANLIKTGGPSTASSTGSQTASASTQSQPAAQQTGGNGWVWDTTYRRYRYWDPSTKKWVWQQ